MSYFHDFPHIPGMTGTNSITRQKRTQRQQPHPSRKIYRQTAEVLEEVQYYQMNIRRNQGSS